MKATFGLKASGLLFNIDLSRISNVLVVDDPAGNRRTHHGRPISCSCILQLYNQLFYSPYVYYSICLKNICMEVRFIYIKNFMVIKSYSFSFRLLFYYKSCEILLMGQTRMLFHLTWPDMYCSKRKRIKVTYC